MSNNKQRGKDALKELEGALNSRDRKEKTQPLTVVVIAAVVLVAIVGGIYWAATYDNEDEEVVAEDQATSTESTDQADPLANFEPLATERAEALPATVTCTYEETGDPARDVGLPEGENISTEGTVTVELDTTAGPIGMELDRSVAPCTVNAIEHLADNDYYDDTICHRLTTSDSLKVLQCGDPSGTGSGGPGFQFANEYPTDEAADTSTPVIYERGTIAMANAGPDTNGSQFFLNYGDGGLPPMYTYFGQITDEGLATLDSIAETGLEAEAAPTGDGAPAEEVRINSATVVE
ncbi:MULTISPECIES: peptidylprolyl isomerase [Corynebacterium]|uniref:Peptidyl-prolyl isomerase n=1 Tax=Corynebacterium pilosum TaxID=35756 RepID=A0A376CPX7_9CORY|nr:peptidylprolyl isomerase [Corynebacterium pilosum]STC70561.1 peptidyl-prolyl isomerase [Corynebacterium pilosum]